MRDRGQGTGRCEGGIEGRGQAGVRMEKMEGV